jgi:hypothetical protein
VRHPKLCLPSRAAITPITGDSIAGHCRDRPGLRIDPPDHVAFHVQNEHIAVRVETNLIGFVQRRPCRRSSVSRVAFTPIRAHFGARSAKVVSRRLAGAAHRLLANPQPAII